MSVSGKRVVFFSAAIWLLAINVAMVFLDPKVNAAAADLTSRSLTLQNGTTDGGSKPSGIVNHSFSFTIPQGIGVVKSIMFEYCTTADVDIGGVCTVPSGLHTDGTNPTTLGTETGISFTTLTNTSASGPGSNGKPYISSATGLDTTAAATAVTVPLDRVTNPDGTNCTTVNCTFYVRIAAYNDTAAAGTLLAAGTVAASTSTQIQLSGTMPESLIFCTGGTVTANCTSSTSGSITFPMLFSPSSTAYTTSQMAASTNATSGYAITVSGPSLKNGTYSIPPMTTAATSSIGTGQFGMNLMANTTPSVGTAINCPTGSTCHAEALTGYNTANTFEYKDTGLNNIADSTGQASDSEVYTASYIVNVSGSQAAGQYTTTLTYICTATF